MAKDEGSASSSKKSKKEDILECITPDLALSIVRFLAKEDKAIAERIRQIALEYLREVDAEDVAEEVYGDLDFIDVHDLWDRSGRKRDEYIDTAEESWVMVGKPYNLILMSSSGIKSFPWMRKPNFIVWAF